MLNRRAILGSWVLGLFPIKWIKWSKDPEIQYDLANLHCKVIVTGSNSDCWLYDLALKEYGTSQTQSGTSYYFHFEDYPLPKEFTQATERLYYNDKLIKEQIFTPERRRCLIDPNSKNVLFSVNNKGRN